MEIKELVIKQREFFLSNKTLDYKYRKNALLKLKNAIIENQDKIVQALKDDLGKSETESYMCEIGMTLSELGYMLKNLRKLMKPKRVSSTLAQFPAKSKVIPCPYGVSLIMSPWNYPFMLAMEPLIDSISAGNTAIIKPGSYAKQTSLIIKEIIESTFKPEYITCVMGGRDVNAELLDQKFDVIFFTGSKAVGQVVLEKASKNFTPVTLELGGKSPCIVDSSANIKLAAKRIAFGKFLNCGQTCVAPDYLLVHESVKNELLKELKNQINIQYGTDPLSNPDYGKIINEKHFERLKDLMIGERVIHGGKYDLNQRIEPTILDNVTLDRPIMDDEIFGPILPVLTFNDLKEAKDIINNHPTPLALYLFSNNKKTIKDIMSTIQFGGGCINDCIMHLASSHMGFGGVGTSGMGAYHGKVGFETFSHFKSVLYQKNYLDLPVRYQPYTKKKEKLMKIIMK